MSNVKKYLYDYEIPSKVEFYPDEKKYLVYVTCTD